MHLTHYVIIVHSYNAKYWLKVTSRVQDLFNTHYVEVLNDTKMHFIKFCRKKNIKIEKILNKTFQ